MTETGIWALIYCFIVLYLCCFPMSISPFYYSYKTIFKCDCKHKRKHHIIKTTGFSFFITGVECCKYCKVCSDFCDRRGLLELPELDLREQYLPKFKEMEYESSLIRKPLSRKLHIRI